MARPKKSNEPEVIVPPIEEKAMESNQPQIKSDVVDTGEYRVHIIKDYYGSVDVFYLNKKDPNYQYRFLRIKDENISLKTGNLLFHAGGWQICPRQHLLKIGIKDTEFAADGSYRRGDTILAFMPKQLYEEKLKRKQEESRRPTAGITRLLKEGDSSIGRDIHESMKGIQTREALRMK